MNGKREELLDIPRREKLKGKAAVGCQVTGDSSFSRNHKVSSSIRLPKDSFFPIRHDFFLLGATFSLLPNIHAHLGCLLAGEISSTFSSLPPRLSRRFFPHFLLSRALEFPLSLLHLPIFHFRKHDRQKFCTRLHNSAQVFTTLPETLYKNSRKKTFSM